MREDWIECTFNEITDIIGDGLHGTPIYNEDGDYYFINGNNLNDGRINIKPETKRVDVSEFLKYQKKLNEQTILLSINGTIGNTAFYDNENVVLGKSACYINLSSQIDKKFIRLNLTTNGFVQYALKNATGSTIKNVGLATVRAYKILLPPLPEQRTIVKKLENLFSSLDAGVADLKKAQQQLKIYRQAVLKKAFEGDFERVRIGDVLNLSKEKHKPDKPGFLFYIGLEHIEKHTGRLTEKVGVEEINTVKNKFNKDEILYGKLRPNLNKVYLANESGVCSTDMLVFKPTKEIIPKFVMQIMLSRGFVNDMSNNTSGVNLPRVSTKYVENYLIPLPNIDEQKEIVKQIESRLSVCDSIEQNIKESLVKAEYLRQSILKKAFEGNLLTTQELAACKHAADYEPASVLLQRIRNEELKIRNYA